jgi:sirohydrochlorin cobaltochelatase
MSKNIALAGRELSLLFTIALVIMTSCGSTGGGNETKGKPVILVVSFGTSFPETRENTIGAIEKAIADKYPNYEVRRAFTSQTVINILKERDGITIDNVDEAITRLKKDGVRKLIVQPTHIMAGFEYDSLIAELKPHEGDFDQVRYGRPILDTDGDFDKLADVITANAKPSSDDAFVFMGHGSEHAASAAYAKLDALLKERGFHNYYVATVEASPTIDDVSAALANKTGIKSVTLQPLMIVAGDHATNDMAGDDDDSWKSILESKGYTVITILKGLGEDKAIQQMFVSRIADLVK